MWPTLSLNLQPWDNKPPVSTGQSASLAPSATCSALPNGGWCVNWPVSTGMKSRQRLTHQQIWQRMEMLLVCHQISEVKGSHNTWNMGLPVRPLLFLIWHHLEVVCCQPHQKVMVHHLTSVATKLCQLDCELIFYCCFTAVTQYHLAYSGNHCLL